MLGGEGVGRVWIEDGQLLVDVEDSPAIPLFCIGDTQAEPGVGVVRSKVERLQECVRRLLQSSLFAA
jgi:hypothetical protein